RALTPSDGGCSRTPALRNVRRGQLRALLVETPAEPDGADGVSAQAAAGQAFAAEVRGASRQRERELKVAPETVREAGEGLDHEGARPGVGGITEGRSLHESIEGDRAGPHA